jgi:hypothetical protein
MQAVALGEGLGIKLRRRIRDWRIEWILREKAV